jgi:hypothetical protein
MVQESMVWRRKHGVDDVLAGPFPDYDVIQTINPHMCVAHVRIGHGNANVSYNLTTASCTALLGHDAACAMCPLVLFAFAPTTMQLRPAGQAGAPAVHRAHGCVVRTSATPT